jgi:3-oxoacyl-[acyl-carrier protein] reductase
MHTSFADQVVLITGGTRGIGRAVVEAFAADGAHVVFTYNSSDAAAEELCGALRGKGGSVVARKVDVRDAQGVGETIAMIEKEHGRLDVLVNNAGIIRDTLILAMEDQDWGDVLATNLTGAFNAIRPAAKLMMRKRKGAIVNVSSIAGSRPGRGHCNYAASKGGLEAMTKALAVELSSRNIRVNCVAPGVIETDMSEEVRRQAGDLILERIPLKRYGRPEEIAHAVQFLASDLSGFITGTVLHVDGGACV